jgi:multiple sugar transport system substrate-binding protein
MFRIRCLSFLSLLVSVIVAPAWAQTTITFRFNDPEAPQMRQALDAFEKQNPDIKVVLQRLSWGDAQQQYLREAAVGTAPDVAQVAQVWTRSFGDAGALRPLDDLIAKTGIGVSGWDAFVARDLAVGPDGKTYGIPWTVDTFAIVYNKDLLAAAGYTSFPKTWKDLRDASLQVYRKTGKGGWAFPAGSCGTPGIWFYMNFYWWSKGHAIIDQRPDGTFFMNITPDQIAEAFDYFNQYLKDGDDPKSMLAVCLWGAPEVVEGMVAGNMAFASVPDSVGAQIVNTYQQRNPDKPVPFAAAPHPADVNGSKTFFGGRMLVVSANSKYPEQAWRLVRFLSQPDPTFTTYYANYVQAQRSLLNYSRLPATISAGFSEQIAMARSWGAYSTGPVAIPFMWNAVGRAAGSVFIGEKSSKEAATDLYNLIAKEFEKNQKK